MSIDVCLKVAFLVEPLTTVGAGVHLDCGVRAHVVRQVRQLFEATPTGFTFVWLFTCCWNECNNQLKCEGLYQLYIKIRQCS